jgi:hypothetical protein
MTIALDFEHKLRKVARLRGMSVPMFRLSLNANTLDRAAQERFLDIELSRPARERQRGRIVRPEN